MQKQAGRPRRPRPTDTGEREPFHPLKLLRENWKIPTVLAGALLCVFLILFVYTETVGASYSLRQPLRLRPDISTETLILSNILPPPENGVTPRLKPQIIENLRVQLHTVQSGETLSGIAAAYGRSLSTLIAYNAVKDARKLQAGATLTIPNADGVRYTVRRGDNLSRIASRYATSVNAIRDWNDLDSDTIQAGEELFIYGGRLSNDEINGVMGSLWIWPTRGEISSRFGMRTSPFSGIKQFHNGLDIHNRTGTPVVASRAGRVAQVGIGPVYGRYVIVRHNGGWESMYAHLDTVLVSKSQYVDQRQRLGTMGNTGMTTGPHLHFGVSKSGTWFDPLKYIN